MSAPARGPLRVALINDHELIIQGVAAMLEPYAELRFVAESPRANSDYRRGGTGGLPPVEAGGAPARPGG